MEIIIDGKKAAVQEGETILQAARRNGIDIPTLCYSDALPGITSCRICMVEVKENGVTKRVASCAYPVHEGMEVTTDNETIRRTRNVLLNLYSARVPHNKDIKALKEKYDVPEIKRLQVNKGETHLAENCVLCGLCVKACEEMGTNAISTVFRGAEKKVGTPFDEPSDSCIGCGACASVCPTEAIQMTQENGVRTIWDKTFELIQCKECGKYFATAQEIAYVKQKIGNDMDMALCEKCKQKGNAAKFKEALKAELDI